MARRRIQTALTASGSVVLPACPATSPILISATLKLPSSTTLRGQGRSVTWLREADNASLSPIIANAHMQGGAAVTLLDTNVAVRDLSIDGNGANQANNLTPTCIYFLGTQGIIITDVEVKDCRSDAVTLNGNQAPFDATAPFMAGARNGFIDRLFINGTVGPTGGQHGWGLGIQNRQRNITVTNLVTERTADSGLFLDASEGTYTNIYVKGTGYGSTGAATLCTQTNANNSVDNPGGGGTPQYSWAPCSPGIYLHNITNVVLNNAVVTEGRYYGILAIGARSTLLSGIVSTNNSQRTPGIWDELHLDLNNTGGYGENHKLTSIRRATWRKLSSDAAATEHQSSNRTVWPVHR